MQVHALFDPGTSTLTYVVYDPESRDALVIDPVLDYDPASGQVDDASARRVEAFVQVEDLRVHWVLETHAHADHLSGAQLLRRRLGARVAIGAAITVVQQTFADLFNLSDVATDGSQFDALIGDGDTLTAGTLTVRGIATPGHTPACMSYLVGDAVFTGDALFMPDFGTGRCDFPAGSATDLYRSVHGKLYALPDETRVFVGHDYAPGGREVAWQTTIGASKATNKQLRADTTEADFVRFRTERDAVLSAPRLLLPSIQVNIRAGHLPPSEDNGTRYLKLPLFGPLAE